MFENWQTFAASNTLETNVTAKQSSVHRKWNGENHPKTVSQPPIHNSLIYILNLRFCITVYNIK